MKIWKRSSVSALASRLIDRAHRLVDDRAEHDRRPLFARRGLVDLPYRRFDRSGVSTNGIVMSVELELLELGQQAVAEHLGRDAGAIGDEEDGAAVRPSIGGRCARYQSCQTGTTPAGSGGRSPRSIQLSPGPWKSEPHEAANAEHAAQRRELRVLRRLCATATALRSRRRRHREIRASSRRMPLARQTW